MCAGTPVISSDVGAVKEAVIDGMTGLTVWNPKDPSLFARAIVRMRNEPGLWEKCSGGSKSMAAAMKEKSEKMNINTLYNMLFQMG
jgi:glycosyltransferase involved in cell wall biosynthesis